MLWVSNASPTIRDTTLTDAYSTALEIDGGSATITNNTIIRSAYGIYVLSGSPSIGDNNISGNATYGLYNANTLWTVNAQQNWWGETSGPQHPLLNPYGRGDKVSDRVSFSPWRFSPAPHTVGILNVRVSLYSNPTTTATRAPYENMMRYFADALYESSNGAFKLGTVTFYPSKGSYWTADVRWSEKCHPSSDLSGYGILGQHITMCDIFTDGYGLGTNLDFTSSDFEQKGAGYTLAHEWGHYYFSLKDEYAGDGTRDSDFQQPHSNDQPVTNSVMNSQWSARGGNFNWLNFSVAKNYVGITQTAQYRVYGASAWDTLVRPVWKDLIWLGLRTLVVPGRLYHAELARVAPGSNDDAPIDFPDDARGALQVVWNAAPAPGPVVDLQATGGTYAAFLSSIGGQEISYPHPILLMASVQSDMPMTGAHVQASVRSPGGSTVALSFTDDGVAPDAVAADGTYSAILPYAVDGVYAVTVQFDNSGGSAMFVATRFEPSLGANGQVVPMPGPTLVGENFAVSSTLLLTVSNVLTDDYGNTPSTAQAMTADNKRWPGKIDYGSDNDVFGFTTLVSTTTYVRIANLALGMTPRLRLIAADQTTVLWDSSGATICSPYSCDPGDWHCWRYQGVR